MTLVRALKDLLPQSEARQALGASRLSLRDMRERRIRTLQIYTTNRCNSRCVHCFVWKYKDYVDLDVDVIAHVLESRSLAPGNDICLEGGEFTLHPQYEDILRLFADRQVCVITNGILTDRIVRMVESCRMTSLMISLDGTPETYARLRGLDVYDRVLETIRRVKDKVPVIVNFTFTPWNGAADYSHVREVCAREGIALGMPNLYATQPYFRTVDPPGAIAGKHEAVPTGDAFQRRYLDYHDRWLRGEVTLPCFSIYRSALIYPEGDVFFCHQRVAKLGNLHEASLDKIWTAETSRALQDRYSRCNQCWCAPHRLQDVYAEPLGRVVLLQRALKDRLFGAPPPLPPANPTD